MSGARAFNSGKPVEDNCFIYTFDESGDYTVISHGAPGYSCVVHIRDARKCLMLCVCVPGRGWGRIALYFMY